DQYLDRHGIAECAFPKELDAILDGVMGDRISGDGHVDSCDPAHCRADRTQGSVVSTRRCSRPPNRYAIWFPPRLALRQWLSSSVRPNISVNPDAMRASLQGAG